MDTMTMNIDLKASAAEIDAQIESIGRILDGEVTPSADLALAPTVLCTVPLGHLVREYLDLMRTAIGDGSISVEGDLDVMRRWSDLMKNMESVAC